MSVFCLVSVLAYGNFFQKVFLKISIEEDINIYTGFYGLMLLTLISLITSYFVQHNYVHNIILHSFGIIYFFSSNFKQNKKFYKHIFYISIFMFSILLISKTHDDFSYYHLPFTKFLTENNIIFGMGHLNLGYNYYGIDFGVSLLNLLDENYESPHGFSQEGRKFTLGFNKSF